MNASGLAPILLIVVLVAGVLGYASAMKSRRWHGLSLAAALACLGFGFGSSGIANSSPVYIGAAFAIIVPWLLGGVIARRAQA